MLQIALNQMTVPAGDAVALSALICSLESAAYTHSKNRTFKGYPASMSFETPPLDIYNYTDPSAALAGSISFIADQLTDVQASTVRNDFNASLEVPDFINCAPGTFLGRKL